MRFILPMMAIVPVALVLESAHTEELIAVFFAPALSLIPVPGLVDLVRASIAMPGISSYFVG